MSAKKESLGSEQIEKKMRKEGWRVRTGGREKTVEKGDADGDTEERH